ncbi:MAG: dihydrodipicolinate reductase [Thermoprotei archaeon]|nr:MAG: dihydrodipicolinate reductase [Thermoprotei archaeon]
MLVGIYGFGAIGKLLAKAAIERGHEIIGVVDIDEKILGRDIGSILGLDSDYGVSVSPDPQALLDADVVLHATGSYLDRVYPQLVSIIDLGLNVVSTCETLAYPYYRYPVLARALDERARLRSVTVLGTGINPGFIMDTLVAVIASSAVSVERVKAVRSIDASKRREPFRRKLGIGREPGEVKEKMGRGELTGHVGYAESVYLIADAGKLSLTSVVEHQELIVADERIERNGVVVEKGRVSGIKGYGVGYVNGREVIRLELYAYVGAEEYEEIVVESEDYSIVWRSRGTPGDQGTAAVLLSIAEKIDLYGPGLLTMPDIIPFKPYFKASTA